MPHCHIHPERPARIACQKVNLRGYCGECLESGSPCFDPNIYCKFRGQCVINEMSKSKGRDKTDEAQQTAA